MSDILGKYYMTRETINSWNKGWPNRLIITITLAFLGASNRVFSITITFEKKKKTRLLDYDYFLKKKNLDYSITITILLAKAAYLFAHPCMYACMKIIK